MEEGGQKREYRSVRKVMKANIFQGRHILEINNFKVKKWKNKAKIKHINQLMSANNVVG